MDGNIEAEPAFDESILHRILTDLNLLIMSSLQNGRKNRFEMASRLSQMAQKFQALVAKRVGDFGARPQRAVNIYNDVMDYLGDDEPVGHLLGQAVQGENGPPQVALLRQVLDFAGPLVELARDKGHADLRTSKVRELNELLEMERLLKESGKDSPDPSVRQSIEKLKKGIEYDLVHSELLRGRQAIGPGGNQNLGGVGELDAVRGDGPPEGGGPGDQEEVAG